MRGGGDDQAALALADGRQQIHHAAGEVVAHGFQLEPLVGIERRQVVEEDLVARFLGRLEVDGVDFDQREVALAFLGRADLAGDGVAGAQVEAADLRGRNVNVVGAGQVVVLGRAQEAEAVGQAFEHAFGEDQAALFGLRLQDLEDQLLLAQAGGAWHAHVLGDLVQVLDAHVLELHQIERGRAALGALRGLLLAALDARGSRAGRLGGGICSTGLGSTGGGLGRFAASSFGGSGFALAALAFGRSFRFGRLALELRLRRLRLSAAPSWRLRPWPAPPSAVFRLWAAARAFRRAASRRPRRAFRRRLFGLSFTDGVLGH